MKKISMVDLYTQYANMKQEIDDAIQEVIDTTAFIKGPQVKLFADNLAAYLDVQHVIPCANGTDALQIALMALDLQPGDEVISPDFTFISTVEVAALLGLKPVLTDVDPDTFTMDIESLKRAIGPRTRAVIPVHLFGLCANMGEIIKIAKDYNLTIIEDNAQALGATYKDGVLEGKAGTLSTVGCTSFFPSKNLGCYGDGGALITNNSNFAERIQCIANHGSRVKYYNDETGVNSRLDTIQAAILNVKLKYLDQYNTARKKAADYYNLKLKDNPYIKLPVVPAFSDHVYHQYTIKVKEKRDELKNYLAEKNIPSMIYYPVAMHNQKAFSITGSFPVTDILTKSVLSIPMHTELTESEQDYICEHINKFFS